MGNQIFSKHINGRGSKQIKRRNDNNGLLDVDGYSHDFRHGRGSSLKGYRIVKGIGVKVSQGYSIHLNAVEAGFGTKLCIFCGIG